MIMGHLRRISPVLTRDHESRSGESSVTESRTTSRSLPSADERWRCAFPGGPRAYPTFHCPVCGPIPESRVNCTATIFADSGTSNTMQPSPDEPGAMFSLPGNDWQAAAVSSADWYDCPAESTTAAPFDGASEYAALPVSRRRNCTA